MSTDDWRVVRREIDCYDRGTIVTRVLLRTRFGWWAHAYAFLYAARFESAVVDVQQRRTPASPTLAGSPYRT